MQIEELSPLVQTLLTWLVSKQDVAAGGLAVTGLFVWFCVRTGSTHILKKRLWRLLLGKHEHKSPVLAKFADERDDLMNFRAMTGLKSVPTAAVAERIVQWTSERDIDIDLVAAAGHHVKVDAPGFPIRVPGTPTLAIAFLLTIVFLYGGLAVAGLAAWAPTAIRVRATDTWYAVTDKQATLLKLGASEAPAIELASCGDKPLIARETGYPLHDVEVLCELLSPDTGEADRRSARLSQVILLSVASLLLLSAGATLLRTLWRVGNAQKLKKRLQLFENDRRIAAADRIADDDLPTSTNT